MTCRLRLHSALVAVTSSVLYFADVAAAKAVFAHYMVGTTTDAHAQTDITTASAAGLDGFVLNIGDPRQSFVTNTVSSLFTHAADNPSFTLLFSLDLSAALGAGASLSDYDALLKQYTSHESYARGGPDGHPFVSTFSDGGLGNETWDEWRGRVFGNDVYFVPDFDQTQGYYDAATGWWDYWGGVVDGLFSWEAAWPERAGYGGAFPGDVGPDVQVAEGAEERGKDYMVGLSALQYKNAYNTNLYRAGELNLPERMKNVLEMKPAPEYAEFITWNDGPESHYLGPLWPEQNTDADPARYASQTLAPHTGWLPLVSSFAAAFRANASAASAMRPSPSTDAATGALWYKTLFQNASCPDEGSGGVYAKPDGWTTGEDVLNWAVVVGEEEGWKARLVSGGEQVGSVELAAGLNYGKVEGLRAGRQRLEVVDGEGKVVRVAAGGRCVSTGCPDGIYNMNPQVVGLADGGEDGGDCSS